MHLVLVVGRDQDLKTGVILSEREPPLRFARDIYSAAEASEA